jgi:hypothetical protein
MVSVVIAALSGTASIGTAGLLDALNKADLSYALLAGGPAARTFEVQLAGLDGGSVSCRDGVSLHPAIAAPDVTTRVAAAELVGEHPVGRRRSSIEQTGIGDEESTGARSRDP